MLSISRLTSKFPAVAVKPSIKGKDTAEIGKVSSSLDNVTARLPDFAFCPNVEAYLAFNNANVVSLALSDVLVSIWSKTALSTVPKLNDQTPL